MIESPGYTERVVEIFAAMRTAFLDLGGVPPLIKFERCFQYTKNVFDLRGWGWPGAKLRFRVAHRCGPFLH